jgi:hypothetical protein
MEPVKRLILTDHPNASSPRDFSTAPRCVPDQNGNAGIVNRLWHHGSAEGISMLPSTLFFSHWDGSNRKAKRQISFHDSEYQH